MRPTPLKVNGWLILNKPAGMTSNKVLTSLKRHFGRIKTGYAGTLDPFATGVLPIAFGEATKLMDHMVDTTKAYTFTIRWGEATDTDDYEGNIIETSTHRPHMKDIEKALGHFQGTIQQVPPVYSAIKVQGKRACDRVRQKEEVSLKARSVFVKSFELLSMEGEDQSTFRVVCGKGTYIRSLARDLAKELETVAHVKTLCREAVGAFSLDKAWEYEKLLELQDTFELQRVVHPMDFVLDDIPALVLGEQEVKKIRHGQSISCPESLRSLSLEESSSLRLQDESKALVAMSVVKGATICPNRVFVY